MHCLTARGSGQCNSCNELPHCLGAVGSATLAMHCHTSWDQWGNVTPAIHCTHCLGAVGSATRAMHFLAACGQWVVQLLRCPATVLGGSEGCNSFNALPHCLRERGQCNSCNALYRCPGIAGQCNSCNPLPHCLGAVRQWAVEHLQCTASLLGGSGQCNS